MNAVLSATLTVTLTVTFTVSGPCSDDSDDEDCDTSSGFNVDLDDQVLPRRSSPAPPVSGVPTHSEPSTPRSTTSRPAPAPHLS